MTSLHSTCGLASKGIDSWDKLKGKTIFNGPPRGGATTAKAIIAGWDEEGDGYTANTFHGPKQIQSSWMGALQKEMTCNNLPTWIPIYEAAGQINIVSVPKAPEGKVSRSWPMGQAPFNIPSKISIGENQSYPRCYYRV